MLITHYVPLQYISICLKPIQTAIMKGNHLIIMFY